MNKNNPINAVYLIALASISLTSFISSFYEALVYAIVIISVFLFSISVVSMIEKIADKHVKFLAFALICSALITILKIVFQYVNIQQIVLMADTLDISIVPCLLIAIVPIYFEDSLSVKQFFSSALLISLGMLLLIGLFGLTVEMVGFGKVIGKSLGFNGVAFFTQPFGKFIIIALITVMFNVVRRAYLKSSRKYNMLVEKYKIQIREIRSSEERKNNKGEVN